MIHYFQKFEVGVEGWGWAFDIGVGVGKGGLGLIKGIFEYLYISLSLAPENVSGARTKSSSGIECVRIPEPIPREGQS